MSDGVTAQTAVGRYVLQIGGACGAVIREAAAAERARFKPRPGPIFVRPKLIRGLVDRQMDLAAALAALDAGLAVEVSGEPGVGKTAVLRHLAHHPRATAFVDGVVYVSARHHTPLDLQQFLFEAFHESDGFCKPTEAEIRRGLQHRQVLILLDTAYLGQDELEQVLEIAPRAAFVVATRERRLWSGVHNLVLKGLPSGDAVFLLEREIERPLDVTERLAAETLCAAVGGNPLRILQAAAVIREQGISIDQCARSITKSPVMNLMASIDDKQKRALSALAALPGVPLQALHVSAIAEVTDVEPSLAALARRGLVVSSESRYQLADGVCDRLRRTEDLKPWTNRVITYFTAWAERYVRTQDVLLQESEVLLRVQQLAADGRRSGEVLHLGRLLEGSLVVGARWGAWAVALDRCLAAAKVMGDRSAEAWALHELGSRALCLGDAGAARALLTQAAKLRDVLNEDDAAAVSRRNLSFVLPPAIEQPQEPAPTPLAPNLAPTPTLTPTPTPIAVLDLGSLPLRDATPSAISRPNTHGASWALAGVLLLAILGGLAYLASMNSLGETIMRRVTARIAMMRTPQGEPVVASSDYTTVELATDPPLTSHAEQALPTDRASILIFTPRPSSITSGGPTRLCYAVANASYARVEPEIGGVASTRALTCVRVAPVRTTTYELKAYGRDGHQVSQQLVIVVR